MNRGTFNRITKVVGLVVASLLVMLLVHFLGGESILPWASFFVTILLGIPSILGSEGNLDLSLDLNRTVESQHETPTIDPEMSDRFDWGENTQKNLQKVNDSPEWRRADDSKYDSWRRIGSILNRISSRIQSSQNIDERHIEIGLVTTVIIGCSWFLIILVKLMAVGGLNPIGFSALAEVSPFKYSIDNLPVFQIAVSLALFIVPLGYLDWKDGTTCARCSTPFSLRSKGVYWHPALKEKKRERGNEVTIYHGVRFRECEECGMLLQNTNYSWEES